MIFLDANIIIYAFKPEYSYILERLAAEDEDIACSEVVRLEVMGFTGLLPAEKRQLARFFDSVVLFAIDRKVIDGAIEIRQQKSIGAADAIIAATALQAKQKLWTSNVEDFGWIKGLQWHNPVSKAE